jgi:hypothetical protein
MYLFTRSSAALSNIEEEDRSGSIKIATWILLGITVAVFIARQIMKTAVFRKFALDDIFICAATVCICQDFPKVHAKIRRHSLLDCP